MVMNNLKKFAAFTTAAVIGICTAGFMPETFPDVSIHASAAESGECGDNLTWTLDGGTLTISGTGDMTDYNIDLATWYDYKNSIKSVIIENGVTSIGDWAFSDCVSLTSVTIPDSVTSIGGGAFNWCENLTSVTIPDSVMSIGDEAFYLTLWLDARRAENPLVIVNNILIDGYTAAGDVIVPNGVKSIADGAFSGGMCDGDPSEGCELLTSITIPDSVTSIGSAAFAWCSNLKSIKIENPDCKIYDESSTISDTATIYGYSGSTAEKYANRINKTFVSIGEYDPNFFSGQDINGIDWSMRLTETEAGTAGELSITGNDKALTKLIWESVAESLPKEVVLDTINVKTEGIKRIEDEAFYSADENSLVKRVVSFESDHSLSSIGERSFFSCTGLKTVTLPSSLRIINKSGFSDCTALDNIYLKDAGGVLYIIAGTHPLDYESSMNAVSEWNFITLSNLSFNNCPKLKYMFVPKSTTLSVSPTGANALGFYLKDTGSGVTATVPLEDFTIYGWSGSSAAAYAKELGFKMIFADGLTTGDINGDKSADTSDASDLLKLYANQAAGLDISKFTQQQITAADLDGDGSVTILDATYILTYYAQYAAGLDPVWENIIK